MRRRAMAAGRKEVARFVDGLRSMDDRDMAVVVAVATVIRVNMEDEGYLEAGLFGDTPLPGTETMGHYQLDLNRVARQFNRMGQPTDALGTMVISFSLRCLVVPDYREYGRAMWGELRRGFAGVEAVLADGEGLKGQKFPDRVWTEWRQVPVGLEPAE